MKVKDLMRTRTLLTIAEDDDMALAQQVMSWGGVRHLPVTAARAARTGSGRAAERGEPSEIVGMLTAHDVLRHRAETGAGGGCDPVGRFMSRPVVSIGPEDEVAAASGLMVAHHIGSLPVIDQAKLVGILTTTDIVASHVVLGPRDQASEAKRRPKPSAGDAMRTDVAAVHPYQPLLEAVGLMVDRNIRHVTVVDDERRVVGIISDRDIRTAIGDPLEALHSELEELEEMKIAGVMTLPVWTVQRETPLADVAKRFVDERIGAVPVVDAQHRPLGIISYVDVIRTLQRALDA